MTGIAGPQSTAGPQSAAERPDNAHGTAVTAAVDASLASLSGAQLWSRGHLLTEQANALSANLDRLQTAALVELFCENERRPQEAVAAAAPQLAEAVDAIAARLGRGGRCRSRSHPRNGRCGRNERR